MSVSKTNPQLSSEGAPGVDYSKQPRSNLKSRYDVIVCGSGSSGSVVAGRLAANSDLQVLLLEAGGDDNSPLVADPNTWFMNLGGERDWNYQAQPSPELNGRAIPYSMGKVLGGGSSINVATWSRGHRADWDHIAKATKDSSWGYASILELYRHVENWTGAPDPVYRATGGPMHVQPSQSVHSFSSALLEASQENGIEPFVNANGAMMEAPKGCSIIDEILHEGARQSVYRSYVYPLLTQPNLTVVTGAMVQRVIFEGKRAVGVEVQVNGSTQVIRATQEIVLSLGAIETPRVLMQSGIGDETELSRFGIPLVHAQPHVGKHLHDHIAIGCTWEATEEPLPPIPRSQVVAFWKTRADLEAPNMLMYSRAGSALSGKNVERFQAPERCWSLFVGMRPSSRASVRLTGANSIDPLKIETGYLQEEEDLQDFAAGLDMCRVIGNSPAFKPFTIREIAPGPTDPRQLEQFIRDGLVTFWHQSGTARMGFDDDAVVDSRLKVNGVERLRIADASVLPRVTTGNTMAPCVIIGEQAARFIQRDIHSGTPSL